MSQSDIRIEDLSRHVQMSIFSSEMIIDKAIEAMNEAGIPPDTAALDFILIGLQELDGALINTQFNVLTLIEQKIAHHRAKLEQEGHSCDEIWEHLKEDS